MYVTGAEHVDLAVLVGDFDDFRLYPVPRHEGVIRQLETRALDWWERYIEAECPPPLSGAECDAEWLKARFPQDTGATIMATPEVDDLCRRYADARRAFVDAQTEKERLENEIKAAMEEASVLETSIGAFTWKRARPTVREKFDAAALKADDPETYARYAVADVTPGSRRFLCPMKDK
jgi:predicted phage-related endonuclease